MNHDLPKSMLDALARQTLPTDHPSADVLTAFAENALADDEYRRTADHLARCGECREVVFLAVGATDKPTQVAEGLAAARGARRWMPRLVLGVSIAAGALVVASALLWWRNESAPSRVQMASKAVSVPAAQPTQQAEPTQPATESKPATASQTTAELAAPPAVVKPQAKPARAKTVTPKSVSPKADAIGIGLNAGIVANESSAPANTAKAAPAAEPTTITVGTAAAGALAPAAPHANAFAAAQGGPAAAAPGSANALLLSPQTRLRAVRAAHPQWRITADGHLEHLTAEGWSRVLSDHAANFRVVSVLGNHVWVGGSGGALFHSRDEGQNWEEVAFATPNGRETATIVSIQFDDPQRGTVTTDTGARCSTTDGGASWNCQ